MPSFPVVLFQTATTTLTTNTTTATATTSLTTNTTTTIKEKVKKDYLTHSCYKNKLRISIKIRVKSVK